MGKKDDDGKAICDQCSGNQGEWIDRNGDSKKQSVWVPCKACSGTGRR